WNSGDNTTSGSSGAGRTGGVTFAARVVVALAPGGVVRHNTAMGDGGGIATHDAEVQVFDSTVRNNSANGDGGGIATRSGPVTLEDRSAVHDNSAGGGEAGGTATASVAAAGTATAVAPLAPGREG